MVYAIVIILVLIIDQGLKYWTVSNIALNTGVEPLIEGIVQLTYVRNYGVAFGFLKDFEHTRWLLVGVTAVFALVVIYMLSAGVIKTKLGRWSAALVLAGALGNGIDRLFIGYVVDMIEVLFIDFYVFNFADICVVVFGILFCLYIAFHKDEEEEPMPISAPKPRKEIIEDDYVESEIDETKRGGDIEMIRRASVRTRPEPAPQPKREPVKHDPENPFSEWDGSPNGRPTEAVHSRKTERTATLVQEEPAQRPIAPPVQAEKSASDDFDLDDILAEFKD